MTSIDLFYRFGAALFIGVLVGLQREHVFDRDSDGAPTTFAGVRTFALLALGGALGAMVADEAGSAWPLTATILVIGLLIATAYVITARDGDIGMTTEAAAVVTVLVGALCYGGQVVLAMAIGVTMTALLSFKPELHGFARRLRREDVLATLKFAIITAIILPLVPNQGLGPPPFDVLNPYKIWLMVIFISGISFLGYVLIKVIGSSRGIGLTGLLGGMVSSTAVTLSFSQRSQRSPQLAKRYALAIIVAWTVMFGRVLVEVGALNFSLLGVVWLPIVGAGLAGLLYVAYLYFSPRADDVDDVQVVNPFELGPAITFGLLYGLVLLVSRAAQLFLGDTGVYLSSLVAGAADVDAITLSLAELSRAPDGIDPRTAALGIVLATMANTAVKGGIILATGSATLKRALAPGIGVILLAGLGLSFLL